MTSRFPRALAAVGAVLALSPAFAQQGDDGKWRGKLYCLALWADRADPEEPKTVEEAFLDTTQLKPRVLPGLGGVTLPVHSTVEGTQGWFDQGVACLHLLWDKEAERAFREVVTLDPDCALGYWGLAMANFDRPGRGSYFSRTAASALKHETPAVVRGLVEPIDRYFREADRPLPERLTHFTGELETLAMTHPELVELKALLLRQLVLNDFRGGLTVRSAWAVDRLAEEVLAAEPSHPCRQSRLFLWMKHRPARLSEVGLLDTEALDPAAPAPAWRYLAEAQQSAGQWEEAARSLVRALDAELAARPNWFATPVAAPAFADDAVTLVGVLSRLGRTREAFALADALMAESLPGTVATDATGAAFLASAPGRGARAHARVCHDHRLLERLPGLVTTVTAMVEGLPGSAAIKAELSTWTAVGAPDINRELTAEAIAHHHLVQGHPGEALEVLAALGESERSAFLPRALWILANAGADRQKEALYGFDKPFRHRSGASDSPVRNNPALVKIAAVRRLPSVWQLPALPVAVKLATELRATTGRIGKSTPAAPAFALPDGRNAEIVLESFRGKPVVVIFFLGAGCFQCVEQLHAFLPEADRYKEAGIPIMCVSSDPISVLQHSVTEKARGGQPIPFTIVSDDRLAVFKRYLVYNEFERRPLHGTFLLDPAGQVRWSHVGNRPFMKPKWLLGEAQRLLEE